MQQFSKDTQQAKCLCEDNSGDCSKFKNSLIGRSANLTGLIYSFLINGGKLLSGVLSLTRFGYCRLVTSKSPHIKWKKLHLKSLESRDFYPTTINQKYFNTQLW